MAIRVALNHKTSYRYDRAVTLFPHVVRLRPAPHARTPILSYSLKVEPKEHYINWLQDPQGNYLARLIFLKPAAELSVEVDLVAEMTVINPFDFFLEDSAMHYPVVYDPSLALELKAFLQTEPCGPQLATFLQGVDGRGSKTIDFLVDLNQQVQRHVKYVVRMESGVQACEDTLSLASGSCRDSAWLMVQVLRNLGLAARFVSGYLIQLTADVKPLEGPEGPTKDFTDLHAWAEVYLPGAGWIGLDATSGLLCGEGHIPLAATPEPASAAPITGSVELCETKFDFSMSVTRIHEDPRVTLPYNDAQWRAIDQLGHRIDSELEADAVHLTMGGEPTFVSIDDMEGVEWNFTAVGPTKRRMSGELLRKLGERFARGGLLHYGQGKWYPGEPLPRWALGCYWRKDGVPIWNDAELIADEHLGYGHDQHDSEQFVKALARRVGVSPDMCIPGYEDPWHYLWKERRLPVNLDPLDSRLENKEERAGLARVFEQGLGHVVGFALPLQRDESGTHERWISGPWTFRSGHMFLLPGDSPMGLRLPLDSLPWSAPRDRENFDPPDPMAPRGPLPTPADPVQYSQANGYRNPGSGGSPVFQHLPAYAYQQAFEADRTLASFATLEDSTAAIGTSVTATSATVTATLPEVGKSAQGVVRSALCVEVRQSRMYVFMPPVVQLEDYLELVSIVEQTAAELGLPVILEGYPPPHDHRIAHVKVTPDPGVIEVNTQPSSNWAELVAITTGVYDDARATRLGTEKFMLDGRHSGTGGGNHVVLGGPTPAESPFLRRPDLLRSLVAYWNNHPSLSYMFSGLCIGPTCQAPRVDEARHESLYELEVALDQIPAEGDCPPWLVDRVFRNLLTDVTGNTHRAEFCIDKLFSPDSASGRLGLVEFRGFEMPPHARMSLAQQLLLRAMVIRFWKTPYRQQLVRWGTGLHDRFLLPHFAWQDFGDVIADMQRSGYAFEAEWFAPHFEFRFPVCGEVVYDGVHVELRSAIEPWNVLGEEPGAGGTVRYVDSSIERLQVKVNGMVGTRHVVTCNGRRLPLHPTGKANEFVAGVRFRAWQPPNCLHPTIPVHAPLIFDVLDTWSERSIGGCSWHVSSPGGLGFDHMPINANEAESRRAARFFKTGHTPGPMTTPAEKINSDYPLTLDLRRS